MSAGYDCEAVGFLGPLRASFWIAVLGVLALYVFFVAIPGVSPAQILVVSVVVAVLVAIFALRSWRMASELGNRGGDPRLRRSINHMRERRGF